MLVWLEAALIAAVIVSIIIIIILVTTIRRCFVANQQVPAATATTTTAGIAEVISTHTERRSSYQQLFGRGSSTKSFFNWADHPLLITDAVENGWSGFAFTRCSQHPFVRPSLLGSLRVTGEHYHCHGRHSRSSNKNSSSSNNNNNNNNNLVVEESWEIGSGSVDFMQKLRFRNINGSNGNYSALKSTVRMALPLPGPPVVKSFPQEAYFEISVLNSSEDKNNDGKVSEGEKTKLLMKQSYKKSSSTTTTSIGNGGEGSFHLSSSRGSHLLEELRRGGRIGGGGGGGVKMTIGLSVGGFVTSKIPGRYPGSIGFNSDGSVFLSGIKLVFESEKEDWAKPGKVIGCGFDPRKKKVYFTVNSELVHVIHCKSEDFGMPLYPIITTSTDITLLVNLGQSSFNYIPSNATRTPNPCFIGLDVNSTAAAALDYEDSRELFSMGRLDFEGLSHSATTESTASISSDNNNRNYIKMEEDEEELEADFFEIVLDCKGK